jgi:uncharacterized protein
MIQDQQGQLLRIFIRESDRAGGRPMHEAVLYASRAAGLAGATVIRGQAGYGHTSRIHTASILRLTEDLPLIIEVVDSADKIHGFLPELMRLTGDKIMTLENVRVIGRRLEP